MSKYEEGSEAEAIYQEGVQDERLRLRKVLEKYHQTFGQGDIKESSAKMEIRYLYDYVMESRSLK